ncbi:SDR family NAD(P)-dependent oxidoreductase [Nonomuraea angiospora]|uniref:SDR family NAD(P)-dependent oxidoreductase n=1 Tax=Nonomuraea angiospora TaxID=46172 RepID=UPI0029A5DB04|nr:SDR family oxidoreductase [Nonomuraea angiospora]MDX3107527.1 SDR family NAD(P)-dependent oxidoreductase [Nonomuraea angiospora]
MSSYVGRRSLLAGAAGMAGVAGMAMAQAAPAAAATGRRYEGKVVLVTGATSGIGREAAIAFAGEGAKVGFCGRRENLGRQVEREIKQSGGEATYIKADVRDPRQLQTFVDRVVRTYGGLHVAMNNAGVQHRKYLTDMTLAEWEDTLATNSRAVWLGIKYQAPHIKESGGGVILVTGSANEFATRPYAGAYAASKGAVTGLVRSAAVELGASGIRVVALSPGTTDTAMVDGWRSIMAPDASDEEWAALKAGPQPGIDGLKRMARPKELATAALALASEDMSFLTGVSVLVDGGMLAGI